MSREPFHCLISKMVKSLLKLIKRKKRQPRNICYCPECKAILDIYGIWEYTVEDNLVSYMCIKCQNISHWFFNNGSLILLGYKNEG